MVECGSSLQAEALMLEGKFFEISDAFQVYLLCSKEPREALLTPFGKRQRRAERFFFFLANENYNSTNTRCCFDPCWPPTGTWSRRKFMEFYQCLYNCLLWWRKNTHRKSAGNCNFAKVISLLQSSSLPSPFSPHSSLSSLLPLSLLFTYSFLPQPLSPSLPPSQSFSPWPPRHCLCCTNHLVWRYLVQLFHSSGCCSLWSNTTGNARCCHY